MEKNKFLQEHFLVCSVPAFKHKCCKLCGDELEDETLDYCPSCEEGLWEEEHDETD